MGKNWLHWVKSSSTKREMKEASASTSTGCMCAVFQIFDLHHHFQLPNLSQQDLSSSHFDTPFQEETTTTSKGLEAPRNSLGLLDQPDAMNVASMPLAMKEQESLNFPVGIHIKTGHEKVSSPRVSASKSRIEDISSDYSSSSPGTKTPTIVARLMGLDLLPECTSPSFSKHQNHQRKDRKILQSRANRSFFNDDIGVGARSLPETPRVSLSRRSDVEYHRRSLQINKENTTVNSRRRRFREQLNEENISPGHYAKQIVKQAKERAGLTDITNTNKDKREYLRRDENLVLLKPIKKKSELLSRFDEESKQSCSSRLRLMENNKKKPVVTNSSNKSQRLISGPYSEYRQGIVKSESIVTLRDSKKLGTEKFISSRLKKLPPQATDQAIRNKKKEPFFRSTATSKSSFEVKKSSKTPLSTEILNLSGPATKLHQKKVEMQSHVPDALSSKKSTPLSSNPHHSYNPDNKIFTTIPDNNNGCTTTLPYTAAAEYKNYVQRILKRAAISDSVTPLTIHQWHTRSHPLDPSIFHYLELFHPSGTTTFLSHRCNRKLIFELVDELLSKMMRPHHKYPLIDELCNKILNFPEAKCRVLEDIDALIDTDLGDRYRFVEDEVEGLVCEIEGEIVDGLVRETVEMFGVRTRSVEQRQRLTGGT